MAINVITEDLIVPSASLYFYVLRRTDNGYEARMEGFAKLARKHKHQCYVVKSESSCLDSDNTGFIERDKGCWIMHKDLFQVELDKNFSTYISILLCVFFFGGGGGFLEKHS